MHTSSGSSLSNKTKETKSLEFRTADGDSPTRGESSVAKNLERLYVGEVQKETIGRKGTPILCILGSPYIEGMVPDEQRNWS